MKLLKNRPNFALAISFVFAVFFLFLFLGITRTTTFASSCPSGSSLAGGKATDSAGHGINNVKIYIIDNGAQQVYNTQTDSNGNWLFCITNGLSVDFSAQGVNRSDGCPQGMLCNSSSPKATGPYGAYQAYTDMVYGNGSKNCGDSCNFQYQNLSKVTVSGNVRDSNGKPLSGVVIELYDKSTGYHFNYTTVQNGTWHIANFLTSGDMYYLYAADPALKDRGYPGFNLTASCPQNVICNTTNSPSLSGKHSGVFYSNLKAGDRNSDCGGGCNFVYQASGGSSGPYCGDGVCNKSDGETCSTCPKDCGSCGGGGGGGGSGGGSGSGGGGGNSYIECESGSRTACNSNGSTTGHYMDVTNNGGSYSCQDLGQYRCNAQPYAACQPDGKHKCLAYLPGKQPPSENILYSAKVGDATNCGKVASQDHISSNASLFCVCGMDGAPACTGISPSPSPTGGPTASLTLVLGLPGIGYNGPVGIQPNHLTRSVTVALYDATVANPSGPGTTPLVTQPATVTYDSGSDSNAGYFVSTKPISITLPSNPPANNQYEILVEMPQYLYELAVNPVSSDSSQVNHAFTITSGTSITIPPLILFPGDVAITNGGLNHLGIDDYNQIVTCFHSPSDPTCINTPDGILYADLDDNGKVDLVDINLWLRSLFQLQQAQAPGCSTGDCQGD